MALDLASAGTTRLAVTFTRPAGGLTPRGLNVLVQVRLGLLGLHAQDTVASRDTVLTRHCHLTDMPARISARARRGVIIRDAVRPRRLSTRIFKTLGAHRLAPVRRLEATSSLPRAPHYSARREPRGRAQT